MNSHIIKLYIMSVYYHVLVVGILLSHLSSVHSMVACQLVLLTVRQEVARHMYVAHYCLTDQLCHHDFSSAYIIYANVQNTVSLEFRIFHLHMEII